MKIKVQIICNNRDEFDRGEQIVCDIIKCARYDDVIATNIVICSKDEENAYAEK